MITEDHRGRKDQNDAVCINCYAPIGGGTIEAGNYAGLQVKTAGSGIAKIMNALKKTQYADPIVYFGLNNDFNEILRAIHFRGLSIEPGYDIANARDIDLEIYEEVVADYYIVLELITKRLSVEDFLFKTENNPAMNAYFIGNELCE